MFTFICIYDLIYTLPPLFGICTWKAMFVAFFPQSYSPTCITHTTHFIHFILHHFSKMLPLSFHTHTLFIVCASSCMAFVCFGHSHTAFHCLSRHFMHFTFFHLSLAILTLFASLHFTSCMSHIFAWRKEEYKRGERATHSFIFFSAFATHLCICTLLVPSLHLHCTRTLVAPTSSLRTAHTRATSSCLSATAFALFFAARARLWHTYTCLFHTLAFLSFSFACPHRRYAVLPLAGTFLRACTTLLHILCLLPRYAPHHTYTPFTLPVSFVFICCTLILPLRAEEGEYTSTRPQHVCTSSTHLDIRGHFASRPHTILCVPPITCVCVSCPLSCMPLVLSAASFTAFRTLRAGLCRSIAAFSSCTQLFIHVRCLLHPHACIFEDSICCGSLALTHFTIPWCHAFIGKMPHTCHTVCISHMLS